MRIRSKIRIAFLIAVAIIAGLLASIYSYVAFRPTGYETFAREQVETERRVQAALASAPAGFPTQSVVGKNTGAKIEPELFSKNLLAADPIGSELSGKGLGLDYGAKDIEPISYRSIPVDFALTQGASGEKELSTEIRNWIHETGKVAESNQDGAIYWDELAIDKSLPNEKKDLVKSKLDLMEQMLLADHWKIQAFKDVPLSYQSRTFDRLSRMVIVRRAVLGEGEKAAVLLERYLEIKRVLQLAQYPEPEERFYMCSDTTQYEAAILLLRLAELKNFPDQALESAAKILDRTLITQRQFSDFRTAHMMRLRDCLKLALQNQQLATTSVYWESMFKGGLDKLHYRILRPVLLAETERLVMALNKMDAKGIDHGYNMVQHVISLISLSFSPTEQQMKTKDWQGIFQALDGVYALRMFSNRTGLSVSLNQFSRKTQIARLLLALGRYRRACGEFPTQLDALAPQYLDLSSVQELNKVWRLEKTAPSGHPGVKAVALCEIETHKIPLDSWRIKAKAESDWQKRLKNYAAGAETKKELEYVSELEKKGEKEIETVQPWFMYIRYPMARNP